MLKKQNLLALLGLISLFAVSAETEVKLPAVLSSNMVIQRNMAAPFWGWAAPGESITVSGSWGASVKTVAGQNGRWAVKLPAPKAGGPFTITVQGKNKIVLTDILSGDVWICSGQSNMFRPVKASTNGAKEVATADYPRIRLFQVKRVTSLKPLDNTEGLWQPCSPETVPQFSAAGYFFGRKLHRELNVPIGLVQSAWGGTPICSWISPENQKDDPAYKMRKGVYDAWAKTYTPEKAEATHKRQLEQWEKKMVEWRQNGREGIKPHRPSGPKGHPQTENPKYPGCLYNAMINPIIPLGIKGAIWYQGEANAGNDAAHYRVQLENLITSWRDVWDQGDFPFYFVQLPNYNAPWTAPVEDGGWPVIREVFMNTAKEVPNTGMAITIDIGEANDIHPKNKQDIGDRLARLALYKTYGKKEVVWTGPIYETCKFKGNKAVITFETGNSPLAVKGDQLKGFAIIDSKGTPFAADAEIQGDDTVIVNSPKVKEARGVYYAWAINPAGVDLINKAGLPASPFRAGKKAAEQTEERKK